MNYLPAWFARLDDQSISEYLNFTQWRRRKRVFCVNNITSTYSRFWEIIFCKQLEQIFFSPHLNQRSSRCVRERIDLLYQYTQNVHITIQSAWCVNVSVRLNISRSAKNLIHIRQEFEEKMNLSACTGSFHHVQIFIINE